MQLTPAQVRAAVQGAERVLVVLDSDHGYETVRAELEAYSEFTTSGSYIVVEVRRRLNKLNNFLNKLNLSGICTDFSQDHL